MLIYLLAYYSALKMELYSHQTSIDFYRARYYIPKNRTRNNEGSDNLNLKTAIMCVLTVVIASQNSVTKATKYNFAMKRWEIPIRLISTLQGLQVDVIGCRLFSKAGFLLAALRH
jgi:hypothetical protein